MTAINTYSTGTVAVANGATSIIGTTTIWSGVNAMPGDVITIGGNSVLILDVTDTTHLTIAPWPYTTVPAGTVYSIAQVSLQRVAGAQAMADVSTLVAALNTDGFYHFVASTLSAPDPSLGDEGQYARQPSTGKEWLKTGGVWVYQGITGNFSLDPNPWSTTTTYARNVIVTRQGKLWLSLQATNLNNPPESSPTWWQLFVTGGDSYEIVNFDTDRPASGEDVVEFVFTQQVTFYAGLLASQARAKIGATATAIYSFSKNGTLFATLTFAAGGQAGPQTGTWSCAADTVFAAGDYLSVTAPGTRDNTLSGVSWTLAGFRSG